MTFETFDKIDEETWSNQQLFDILILFTIFTIFDHFDNILHFFFHFWQFLTISTLLTIFEFFYNFQQSWQLFTILAFFDKFWQFWPFLQFCTIFLSGQYQWLLYIYTIGNASSAMETCIFWHPSPECWQHLTYNTFCVLIVQTIHQQICNIKPSPQSR